MRLVTEDDATGGQMVDGVRMPAPPVLRLVAELRAYPRNSKKHPKAQVQAIAANIKRVGWTNPILIADGQIIAGHGRLDAAQLLGLSRVPCIDLSHLSEEDRRAQVIWDNRSGDAFGATWDLEALKLETDELRELGLDLEATTGFSEEDLADLFRDLGEPETGAGADPDDAPPLPDEPVSRLGDVWVCGAHRVCCGSSTSHEDWTRLMGVAQADVVWCDPPYNVDIGGKNEMLDKADGGNRAKTGAIKGDKMSDAEFRALLDGMMAGLFDIMKPGAPIYVAHADKEAHNFRGAFNGAGFKFSSMIIWKKNMMVLGRSDFQPIHEPVIYGWKPGAKHRWYGGRKNVSVQELASDGGPITQLPDGRYQVKIGDSVLIVDGGAQAEHHESSIISAAKPAKSGLHPTQKPVELVERQLKFSARPGDIVADCCGGSGTTLVAADRLGMCARLMELDPRFVDVIVQRWQMLTGRRATLEATGELFPGEGEARAPADAAAPAEPEPNEDVF